MDDNDDDDDGDVTQPSGSDEPTSLEIWGSIFTDPGFDDQVTAVSAQDDRFDGVDLWQEAFEEIAQQVREGDEWIDDPDREFVLVEADYDTTAARTAREIYAELPESAPEGYPAGKYVTQTVDGESVFTRVRTMAPTPD